MPKSMYLGVLLLLLLCFSPSEVRFVEIEELRGKVSANWNHAHENDDQHAEGSAFYKQTISP